MESITILAGQDKNGKPEAFSQLQLQRGTLYTIVGHTGSGKSRFIKDIEQLADGDSITRRRVLVDHQPIAMQQRNSLSMSLIAHLSQNMRFVLDTSVAQFLQLHRTCRNATASVEEVIAMANTITPERIVPKQNLNTLSGGQTRALMIADIACICDSPVVLIDEIENAGIDKTTALQLLTDRNKLVLIVTHDPHTALLAKQRIILENGAIQAVVTRTEAEQELLVQLGQRYAEQQQYQNFLRKGACLQ